MLRTHASRCLSLCKWKEGHNAPWRIETLVSEGAAPIDAELENYGIHTWDLGLRPLSLAIGNPRELKEFLNVLGVFQKFLENPRNPWEPQEICENLGSSGIQCEILKKIEKY